MRTLPPRPGMARVVYSDLDGTMVGPHGCFFFDQHLTPTLEPARALVDLLTSGPPLVLVSGRTRPQLEEACRIFGADGYVGELGAVIGWGGGRQSEVLHGAMPALPDHHGETPVQVLRDTGLTDRMLARYAPTLEFHSPWHEGHEADVMVRGRVDVPDVEAWLAEAGFDWLRLRDNGVLPAAEVPGVTGPVHVYHLLPAGLSKGLAVRRDLQRRGIDPADAVAIGDSVSDLTMAPYVDRFFLVANGAAAPATAEVAGTHANVTVCTDANGIGWAEAVRWALGS